MNDLTSIQRLPALPKLSKDLETWFWTDGDMDWLAPEGNHAAMRVSRYRVRTAAVIAEAKRLLPAHLAAAKPISVEALAEWLRPLAVVVRNPMSADVLAKLAPILAMGLSDVPCGAFTEATWRRAAQAFQFWPALADIVDIVRDEADDIRQRVTVLRYLADR